MEAEVIDVEVGSNTTDDDINAFFGLSSRADEKCKERHCKRMSMPTSEFCIAHRCPVCKRRKNISSAKCKKCVKRMLSDGSDDQVRAYGQNDRLSRTSTSSSQLNSIVLDVPTVLRETSQPLPPMDVGENDRNDSDDADFEITHSRSPSYIARLNRLRGRSNSDSKNNSAVAATTTTAAAAAAANGDEDVLLKSLSHISLPPPSLLFPNVSSGIISSNVDRPLKRRALLPPPDASDDFTPTLMITENENNMDNTTEIVKRFWSNALAQLQPCFDLLKDQSAIRHGFDNQVYKNVLYRCIEQRSDAKDFPFNYRKSKKYNITFMGDQVGVAEVDILLTAKENFPLYGNLAILVRYNNTLFPDELNRDLTTLESILSLDEHLKYGALVNIIHSPLSVRISTVNTM